MGIVGKEGLVGRPGPRAERGLPGLPGERGPPGQKVVTVTVYCIDRIYSVLGCA